VNEPPSSPIDPDHRRLRLGARVAMAILRLAQAVKKLSLEESADAGLTPVQAQTLLFIRYTKPFLATIGNLAGALGTTHVTAIGVVNGLAARSLVQRLPNPADRRSSLLRLTAAGQETCRRLERWQHTLEESVGALDPADVAALERGLGAVVWTLRAAGHLQVAEPCRGCVHFQENARPGNVEPHRCALIEAYLSEADSRLDCPDHVPHAPADRRPALCSS
jgi:DNA-binding MarR family transcriptional regulator